MSSRPQFNPYKVISSASMAADVFSAVTIVQKLSYISYEASWTGTPTGTFKVEVSNSYALNADGTVANAGTWEPLTLSIVPGASGSSGNGFIEIDGTGSYAMRLHYVASSGSGTLTAIVNAKVS